MAHSLNSPVVSASDTKTVSVQVGSITELFPLDPCDCVSMYASVFEAPAGPVHGAEGLCFG